MRTSGEAGFTLIEMLVVLVILGMAGALLLSRGPARSPGLEARAAASEIVQTMRLGRSRAVASDRPVAVVVGLRSHRLTLDGVDRPALARSVTLAVVMADGSIPAGDAVFVFAPDGSATGGRVALDAGGRRIAMTVDWLSGRVGLDAR